jgi:signal transduction histidine kinase
VNTRRLSGIKNVLPALTTAVLVAAVFALDLYLPLGVADGVLYLIPVVFSLFAMSRFSAEVVAGLCVILTCLGLLLSPPAREPMWMVFLNRGYAVLALGLVVVIGRLQSRILEQSRAVSVMEERERLARDLHDGVAQTLGYVGLSAATVAELLDRQRYEEARLQLTRLGEVAEVAKQDLRQSIQGLRLSRHLTPELEGSAGAFFQKLAAEEGVNIHLLEGGNSAKLRFAPSVAVQVVHIVQEALRNVRKHAGVAEAEVSISDAPPWKVITIRDRGRGFAADVDLEPEGHFGLPTMRERAQSVGGELRVESRPGHGTTLELRIPHGEEKN